MKYISLIMGVLIASLFAISCKDTPTETDKPIDIPDPDLPKELLLLCDTTSIAANNKDTVFFQVMLQVDDQQTNVTDHASIQMLEGETLEAPHFFTSEEGTYLFQAAFDSLKSQVLSIEAVVPQTQDPDRTYQVGDLYKVGNVEGVVFQVSEDGKSGMIVSLDEAFCPWSDIYEQVGAFYMSGETNCWAIYDEPEWEKHYPAAKWCYDHGEGWFLPCYEELEILWKAYNNGNEQLNPDAHAVFEQYFTDPVELGSHYWSSTEINDEMATTFAFIVNDVTCTNPYKTSNMAVRAVRKF